MERNDPRGAVGFPGPGLSRHGFDGHLVDGAAIARAIHLLAVHDRGGFAEDDDAQILATQRQRFDHTTDEIEVRVPGFSLVPYMLIGTRRVAVMHSHLANEAAKMLPIRTFELPFALPLADETAQWHVMREADEGVRWLLAKLASLSRSLQC